MTTYFLDSSAIVKRYRDEVGSAQVLRLFESGDRMIASRLAVVEVVAAFARRAKTGAISDEQVGEVARALETDLRELFEVIELETAILTRSVDLIRMHKLRAADAIHLACALKPAGRFTTRAVMVFVSSDMELNAAAANEGLKVLDPQRET